MPKITKALSPTQVKNAKARDKDYSLFDGQGLELVVKRDGTMYWQFRYTRPTDKKRTRCQFGSYPDIGLADARALRESARAKLAKGVDPTEQKRAEAEQAKRETEYTLEKVARQWWSEKKKGSVTDDHADDIIRSLERDVFPTIGAKPISTIGSKLLIATLETVKQRGNFETARRIASRLKEVFDYALNREMVIANPAVALLAETKAPKKQHMPALPPSELPRFLQALASAQVRLETRCLIEWQLLTMVRPGEAVNARWADIRMHEPENGEQSAGMIWAIPGQFMKMKQEHIVPLSAQALAVLDRMRPISGHREWVFPSVKDPRKPMHSQTANAALIRMGFGGELVAHGLRSIARTAIAEIADFDHDSVEACLAHSHKNPVVSAYNRAGYLLKRVPIMQWWGDYVAQAASGNLLSGRLRAVG